MYYERAGFGERLVAYLIDSFIVGLIAGIPAGCLAVLISFTINPESDKVWGLSLLLIFIIVIIAVIGSFLYYGLMWSRTGQTLGKKVMGLRVITLEGVNPSFWRSIGRVVIGYGLSSAFFNLGFLWMLWDENKQTWHDKLFGTYVVKA